MNVVLIVSDTLNRFYLTPYGAKGIQTPNFERLAKRSVTFDSHWTGSLFTIPCRHEILTGRLNYLWREWGPLEPYDLTIPALCEDAGKVSMLITDLYHYFQKGAGNYHMDFTGWDFIRGHETDNWITKPVEAPHHYERMIDEKGAKGEQYMRNTIDFRDERDYFGPKTLNAAAEWLDDNHTHEDFFLMVDCFDVHEPFHVPPPYDTMYSDYDGDWSIWSNYGLLENFDPDEARHIRAQYMGKITMFDKWLGHVLDRMDRYDLWDDTLFLFTADHGHLLGENDYIGKGLLPMLSGVTNIPLFVSAPGMKMKAGRHSKLLTSQVDLYPTICEALGVENPASNAIHGFSMMPAMRGEVRKIRDVAHTGSFGRPICVTDGRHALHKMPARADNQPLFKYGVALDGFHTRNADLYKDAETGRFLPYTDATVYRAPIDKKCVFPYYEGDLPHPDLLFDLKQGDRLDQDVIADNPKVATRLAKKLAADLRRIQAPAEQFERLGL